MLQSAERFVCKGKRSCFTTLEFRETPGSDRVGSESADRMSHVRVLSVAPPLDTWIHEPELLGGTAVLRKVPGSLRPDWVV